MTLRDGAIQAMAEVMYEYRWAPRRDRERNAEQAQDALDALLVYLREHEAEWEATAFNVHYGIAATELLAVLEET